MIALYEAGIDLSSQYAEPCGQEEQDNANRLRKSAGLSRYINNVLIKGI